MVVLLNTRPFDTPNPFVIFSYTVICYFRVHGTKPPGSSITLETRLFSCKNAFVSFRNEIEREESPFRFRCECASQVWSCAWNLDDPNLLYAGLNSGRVQVFDRRQVTPGETTLSSSVETLSLSTSSPIVSLQYIQKNSSFQLSGLIVGSNDKTGFYEYLPNNEYRYHALPIDSRFLSSSFRLKTFFSLENLSSLHYDSTTNRLLASFRPQSSVARHEIYEMITRPVESDGEQSFIVSLQLIQTFVGSSINIVLSRSKIVHKNLETYVVASDNGAHGVRRRWTRKGTCVRHSSSDRIVECSPTGSNTVVQSAHAM